MKSIPLSLSSWIRQNGIFIPCIALLAPCVLVNGAHSRENAVDFNREIRPILSDRCFQCHGPDADSRQAELRLDSQAGATAELSDGGHAVVPGKPAESVMIERMRAEDEDMRMPPPESKLSLTPDEINRIERWIKQGARYERHWAFVPPPEEVPVPEVHKTSWPRSDLDRFVLARLESENLKPSAEAEKVIWLRRVTLDLIGLPPTREEIGAFLADESAGAYEAVVDRLLASPHFGERLAAPWLDAARYADSFGYQSDQLSPTWPWRDWVIRALNDNLPYDQFLTWQIAGDLLPNATRDQKLATAFNRLHRMTNEGGTINEEFLAEYVADRVQTLGTAVLGLTLECARCHDHKFDPIKQREFYSLTAFFNSIDEWGMYQDSVRVPTPSLLLPTDEQEKQREALRETIRKLQDELERAVQESDSRFETWLQTIDSTPTIPGLVGHYPLDEIGEKNLLDNLADEKKPATTSEANQLVEGHSGKALRLVGDEAASFPDICGSLRPSAPFSLSMWLQFPKDQRQGLLFHCSSGTDVGYHGTELSMKDGRLFFAIVRFWPGNAIAVRSRDTIATDRWVHVTVTYDASYTAGGMCIYVDGQRSEEIVCDNLFKLPQHNSNTITFGQRFRDRALKGLVLDELQAFNCPLTPIEVAHLHDGHSLAEALASRRVVGLRDYYLSNFDSEVGAAREALRAARNELLALQTGFQETMVMRELPTSRPTYLLARGQYDAPKNEKTRVSRVTPAVFGDFPLGLPRNRLGLARWLTQPNHPLTARVEVNRLWQTFFGRGLVPNSENFGTQGSPPTYPGLLDWLARDFIRGGWDVKRFCKQVVLSATYRQSSVCDPELLARDPKNDLLARGPSHRLPAEVVRDVALAAAGLLNGQRGGPPVSPYQPPGLWKESNAMSPAYRQSVGQALYRRSVYSVCKRTAPLPNMIAFDAVSRETCTARRQTTNTPIQALVLLNDVQFVEAARGLGQRMLLEGGHDPAERIKFAFVLLAAREPTDAENALLVDLFNSQREWFKQHPEEAEKLLAVGSLPIDKNANHVELAAATVVSQTILNLDATIWKR